jgi:hypothetical protein
MHLPARRLNPSGHEACWSINVPQLEGFVLMWNPRLFIILCISFVAATTIVRAIGIDQKESGVLAPAIIPQPLEISTTTGSFTLNRQTVLVYAESERDLLPCMTALARALRQSTGYPLRIVDLSRRPAENAILLSRTPEDTLGAEGYRVIVRPGEVLIHAATANGVFYGVNTLLQLFPPAILSEHPVKGAIWTAPCVNIIDAPRYPWRGMMLDVSRHFFPKEFVKRFIDYLAMHKMNTFHWHLTDDQGWRIQINRYPELTSIGGATTRRARHIRRLLHSTGYTGGRALCGRTFHHGCSRNRDAGTRLSCDQRIPAILLHGRALHRSRRRHLAHQRHLLRR